VSVREHAADRPATFRQVLSSSEYRAIYGASTLSWLGDSMARAAVTALVYQQTSSVLASGATFAISYLPWLGLGPVLAALAERYPYRRVMVICDLARMGTMALVAVPHLPIPAMLLMLFATALLNPPFDAARSALLPRVLDGDRYVVGLTVQSTTAQAALITGYFLGGALAAYDPRLTILLNAATFGFSAFLVGLGVHARRPALRPEQRTRLLRETGEGFGLVFGTPVLRAVAVLVFSAMLFATVPEGLAAGWAATLSQSRHDRGWIQGLIMMAAPCGFVVGSLIVGRLIGPTTRRRLIRPVAILAPVALVPALLSPPLPVVVLMSFGVGAAAAALMPVANGLFVQALPNAFRARAFGVMQSGVQLLQGAGVLIAGALADRYPLPLVVGGWGVLGVAVLLVASVTWPAPADIDATIERTRLANNSDDERFGGELAARAPAAGTAGPRAEEATPVNGNQTAAGAHLTQRSARHAAPPPDAPPAGTVREEGGPAAGGAGPGRSMEGPESPHLSPAGA
jgi:MFS family permease